MREREKDKDKETNKEQSIYEWQKIISLWSGQPPTQHNPTLLFSINFHNFWSVPTNKSINQSEEEEGEERESIQELSLTLQKENWTNFDGIWEVVATQLEGWSLPTPDVPVSNAVIGKLFLPLLMLLTVLKRRQLKKRPGMAFPDLLFYLFLSFQYS